MSSFNNILVAEYNTPTSSPRGLEWNGRYFIHTENGSDNIYLLKRDGTIVRTIGTAPDTDPVDISWDGKNIWLSGAGSNKVYKLDKDGNNLCDFSISTAQGIHVIGNRVYVNEPANLSTYDFSGNLIRQVSLPGTNRGLYWDGQYFWGCGGVANQISQYNIDGDQIASYFLPAGGTPQSITRDEKYWWIVDTNTNKIYQYT